MEEKDARKLGSGRSREGGRGTKVEKENVCNKSALF